jgi:Peptidase family M28
MSYVATHERVRPHSYLSGLITGSIRPVGVLLFILFFVSLSIYRQNVGLGSANAPPAGFSWGRAMTHLEAIAQKPHPVGTLEHQTVRDYIVSQLTSVGANPSLQTTTAVDPEGGGLIRAASVENIVSRLRGTENSRAIMLVAHYDSAPISFGAGDDGAAVAMMLETLRALRAGPPLKNDVIFLFTDGEEAGLLGATAFVKEHAWFEDVGLVLNFEARGSKGPSIMFETSNQNGWLIKEFAKVAPHPISHSLAYEIYRLLPNDTDLTIFKEAGLPGLNFAFIDGYMHYHTPLDNLAEVDERSLLHHGANALALTRHFGNLNLANPKQENAVYFDILGLTLLHYPGTWVMPLTILVTILFAALIVFGIKRKHLNVSGILLGLAAILLSVLLSSGIATLVWKGIRSLPGPGSWTLRGDNYVSKIYLLSFIALTIAVTALIYLFFRRKVALENLIAGSMLFWVILLVLTSLYVPGASYLLTFPLLFAFGLFAWLLWRKERRQVNTEFVLLASVAPIPAIILLAPVIYQSFIGLTLNQIGLVMAWVVLLLGLLIPLLHVVQALQKWIVPASMIILSLGLMLALSLFAGFDERHPKMNSIFYCLNADSGLATWASVDKKTDEWTSQFLSSKVEVGSLPQMFSKNYAGSFLKAQAPVAPLSVPEVKVLDDQRDSNNVRTLRLHISSPRKAQVMSLYVDSSPEILSSSLNGKEIAGLRKAGSESRQWVMRYYGLPAEGIEVSWKVKSSEPLHLRIVDQSYGLPSIPGNTYQPRPSYMIPFPAATSDSTLVSKTFVL